MSTEPTTHDPTDPPPAAGGTTTSTGLEPAIAGLLAYALGWLSGLVLFLIEKDHRPTRFHAAQSLVLFGGATVFWVAVSALVWIPVLGWLIAIVGLLMTPVFLGLWIFLMVRAYQLHEVRLPVIASLADRLVA